MLRLTTTKTSRIVSKWGVIKRRIEHDTSNTRKCHPHCILRLLALSPTQLYAALSGPLASSGIVYVMETGKVVGDYADPNRGGDLFLPPDGVTLWLLTGPTFSQVVSSGPEISGEFNAKIVLDGSDDVVVAQYAGMLTLVVDEIQGVAELSVTTDERTVFRYTFADSGGTPQASEGLCGSIPGACCCANCPRGSRGVYGNGPCSCFCGLFGEPICITWWFVGIEIPLDSVRLQ